MMQVDTCQAPEDSTSYFGVALASSNRDQSCDVNALRQR